MRFINVTMQIVYCINVKFSIHVLHVYIGTFIAYKQLSLPTATLHSHTIRVLFLPENSGGYWIFETIDTGFFLPDH